MPKLTTPAQPCWLYAGTCRAGGVLEIDSLAAGPEFEIPAELFCRLFREVWQRVTESPHPRRRLRVVAFGRRGVQFAGIRRELLPELVEWVLLNIGPEIQRQARTRTAADERRER